MSQTVLIVDDEERFRQLIRHYLEAEGFTTLQAADGLAALEVLRANPVDLVILDLMMPRMDGAAFCRELRTFSDVYVLILTARADEDDHLLLYELGADDYMVKPFSCKVLTSKVRAILSRVIRPVESDSGVQINRPAHSVTVDGTEVYFTPKEYDILLYLIDNSGIVLSRDRMIERIWGADADGYDRMVDMHVSRIRDKLGTRAASLVTVKSKGYRWVP